MAEVVEEPCCSSDERFKLRCDPKNDCPTPKRKFN